MAEPYATITEDDAPLTKEQAEKEKVCKAWQDRINTGIKQQTPWWEAGRKRKKFILTIAPEGTRHFVREWKRGFYHIAKGAGVPLVFAKVDGKHRIAHVGEVFHTEQDMEADMQASQGAFKGLVGINPRKKYITLEG